MLFRRRRLTCQQVVELVTEYLEGVMEPARRARFEAHLDGCQGCTNYLEQVRTTVAVVGRLDVSDVPAPVMSELLSAFRNWADEHNGA
jgi:predicted anti-sigma-YlaC factor YlaD